MVQTYRSSILPLVAFVITIMALSYSACHESKAMTKSESSASELIKLVSKFEQGISELKSIHAQHLKTYGDEMGCSKDSKALAIINRHNELIENHLKRLRYHKMQISQTDTTNNVRNNFQITEVKKDLVQLEVDKQEIRAGFNTITPSHVSK